jgi:hypothetical protein
MLGLEILDLSLEVIDEGLAFLASRLAFDGVELILNAVWVRKAYSVLQREASKQPAEDSSTLGSLL